MRDHDHDFAQRPDFVRNSQLPRDYFNDQLPSFPWPLILLCVLALLLGVLSLL